MLSNIFGMANCSEADIAITRSQLSMPILSGEKRFWS